MTEKSQLFVRTLDGKSIDILVNFNDRVKTIKELIYKKMGIEINKQRLIYCGQLMENEKVINSYNIMIHSSVHLVILDEKEIDEENNENDEKIIKIDSHTLNLIIEMKKNFDKLLDEYKLLKLENEKLKNLISDSI